MCVGGFIIIIIVGEASIQFKVQNETHNSARASQFSSVGAHVSVCCAYGCVSVKYVHGHIYTQLEQDMEQQTGSK